MKAVALLGLSGGLLLSACLASSKRVRMPDGGRALRVECNYTFDNCKRRARDVCHGDYEVVTTGDLSCQDCGLELGTTYTQPDNNVYKGVLYVRCR